MALYDGYGNLISAGTGGGNTAVSMPHYGYNCLVLGDSNLAFMSSAGNGCTINNLFAGIGMSCRCYAGSGAAWYWSGMSNTASSQLDAFISQYGENQNVYTRCLIMMGTNDEIPGAYTDAAGADTMVGKMRQALDRLLSMPAFATGIVWGVLPPLRYDDYTGNAKKSMPEKVELLRKVYADYCIPVLDLYYGGNLRQADMKADNIHLSDGGYKKLTTAVRGFINSH